MQHALSWASHSTWGKKDRVQDPGSRFSSGPAVSHYYREVASFLRQSTAISGELKPIMEASVLVTDIEISQYEYCASSARHTANVSMRTKDRMVTMFCQLILPEGQSARARTLALVGEAMRQLRRMPEFRSGQTTLEFAGKLNNDPLPLLA